MKRREFIATVVTLPALGACASPRSVDGADAVAVAEIGRELRDRLTTFLAWLAATPWQECFVSNLGVALPSIDGELVKALTKDLSKPELDRIRSRPGFDDFGGKRLLEPGKPALSLLYFALASPRVRLPAGALPGHYPDIGQLDDLEDVIYAMQDMSGMQLDDDNYVLAVFAYEFRPAARTPHKQHADMVFSRTGVSRVGTRSHRWNRERRSFDNVPLEAPGQPLSTQDAATTPARFGLFLARVVRRTGLQLQQGERADVFQHFLLPVRKLVNGDPLLAEQRVEFRQYHRDEKLYRLTTIKGKEWAPLKLPRGIAFDRSAPPFLRVTCSSTADPVAPLSGDNTMGSDQQLVVLAALRSSVLLDACPAPLVRDAVQIVEGRRERLRFLVPPHTIFNGQDGLSNRRYTTLKLVEDPRSEALAFFQDDILFGGGRPTTTFTAPRNGPSFVNIRYMVEENDGSKPFHLGPGCGRDDWEQLTKQGEYWAAMFQDNLCDGCVSARLVSPPGRSPTTAIPLKLGGLESLPAFSLVAAPDFMQLVDGNDLRRYDEHFLEGGTETVSGARVRANPHLRLPGTERQAFPSATPWYARKSQDRHAGRTALTVTAVVSEEAVVRLDRTFVMDYQAINSLPDTASNVFAPGWDITYSTVGKEVQKEATYFASFGLGSPFPEDMKLCAAANGMWPASSPDASRTFYPSLGEVINTVVQYKKRSRRPPTAVPLLDEEIGHHPQSHAVLEGAVQRLTGWDGEYGPFLTRFEGAGRKLAVNFTAIDRADYVSNVLSSDRQMKMGALQSLTAEELIGRMAALKTCVENLPNRPVKVRLSKLWLVSAEAVPDWRAGAKGSGLPSNLTLGGKEWAQVSRLGPEGRDGYLFVFAADLDDEMRKFEQDPARAVVACGTVYVCQLARTAYPDHWRLAWVELKDTVADAPSPAAWNVSA